MTKNSEDFIKFYANYKNGRYYISGKNHKNKWFSLWKNPKFEEHKDLYLDTELFKGGLEISKDRLKLLENEDGDTGKVLVFKTREFEKDFLVSKKEIEKRKAKKDKQKNTNVFDYIKDIIKELFKENEDLNRGKLINQILQEEELEELEEDDDELPF